MSAPDPTTGERVKCWRSECRTACYYPDACSEAADPTAGERGKYLDRIARKVKHESGECRCQPGERECDEDFGYPGNQPHAPHAWDALVQDHHGAPWREETFRCPGVPATPDAGPRCDTCGDTGRIPWMIEGDPNCYQEPDDEGMLPCPDCIPATPDAGDVEALTRVLIEHAHPGEILTVFGEAWIVCGCGQKIDIPVVDDHVSKPEVDRLHAAHVAASVIAARMGGAS